MAVYAWRERRRLGATLVLTVILSLLAAVEPLPLKLLVDNAIGGAPLPPLAIQLLQNFGLRPDAWLLVVMAALATLLILMAIAFLIAAISWLWAFAGQAMVVDLTTDLFSRLQRLSLQFHRMRPLGDSLSRLTTDTWSVYSFTSILVAAPIREMATFAAVGIVAWKLDTRLAMLCVGMAPLLGFSAWWFGKRLKARARQGRQAHSDVVSFVHQILSALPLVQAFRSEGRNRASVQCTCRTYCQHRAESCARVRQLRNGERRDRDARICCAALPGRTASNERYPSDGNATGLSSLR